MKWLFFSMVVILCGCSSTSDPFYVDWGDTGTEYSDTDSCNELPILAWFDFEDAGVDASDVDTDVDTDTETNLDTNTETEIDINTDTSTDTETALDTDTLTDTGTGDPLPDCPYECVSDSFCSSLGGSVYDEYGCSDTELVCCLVEVDTGSCPYECSSEMLCDVMSGTIHYGFDCGPYSEEICCEFP